MHNSLSITELLAKAQEHCVKRSLRFTTKRCNVLTLMLQMDKPLSAYELITVYQQQFGQLISSVSIYRILNFLLEANLVHKLVSNHKYIACIHIGCTHAHSKPSFLICDTCDRVIETDIQHTVERAIQESAAANDFTIENPQLELRGSCLKCQA